MINFLSVYFTCVYDWSVHSEVKSDTESRQFFCQMNFLTCNLEMSSYNTLSTVNCNTLRIFFGLWKFLQSVRTHGMTSESRNIFVLRQKLFV